MYSPSQPRLPVEKGTFGELGSEGFRITRWDAWDEPAGRHWLDAHSLVLCLNLCGTGKFHGRDATPLPPGSMLIAAASKPRLHFERVKGEQHRFVIVEMRRPWVLRWLEGSMKSLREPVRQFLAKAGGDPSATGIWAMPTYVSRLAADVARPPNVAATWACWHHAKALEIVSHALIATDGEELFCERTRRMARERVAKVKAILLADLENPPALVELGRRAACSPFYLSRTFRQETGTTISAFLRRARLERAAELLQFGEANVTEAALTVGYSSLSHFSKAFAEAFGCCPCLYGRRPHAAAGRSPIVHRPA